MIEDRVSEAIKKVTREDIELEAGRGDFGDFCLTPGQVKEIAKKQNLKPKELAKKIEKEIAALGDRPQWGQSPPLAMTTEEQGLVKAVKYEGGYINIYLSDKAYLEELMRVSTSPDEYLKIPEAEGKTIVFDYSGPNIAKPFSVGHLRSTVIGQANYNIYKALGYKCVGINHIGDWGTQFGKLIYAIKTWGDEAEIKKNPINELNRLYVKFHDGAEKNPTLEDEARVWFTKLEDGDVEARRLWRKCVDWSFKEFDRVYKILDVTLDEVAGESFYEDKLPAVISELKEKGLLKESEGAQIVELDGMPPALIKKKDGATLYFTRDLAALKYRIETYRPVKIIYHVGNDQALHFKQLEAVAKKLGWLDKTQLIHASHGLMRLPEGKMSTRAGRTVLLDDLISEAKSRAAKIIEEKNPGLEDKDEAAQKIAVSAIKYADLSGNRKSDVVFTLDRFISLRGNSGPYLQYSYARACAILRKFKEKHPDATPAASLDGAAEPLAKSILRTQSAVEQSADSNSPNLVAELAYQVANEFNSLYEKERIVTDSAEDSAKKVYIIQTTKIVLGKLFDLLGIAKLEEI